MKILELFAGIGACSTALKRIGMDIEIVDAVEIDKYAIASFNAIHKTNFEIQDIIEYDKVFEDLDLITHGSPCQDFSVAGKQAGGDLGSGTRSSLMYETIRIVGQNRPKYVLWENVKNLLSAKHKHNFDKYIETMNTLGYNSYCQVLNAKDYGIPQNRERVYTISIRKDIDKGNFVFPQKEELKLRLKDMLEDEVDEKYYLSNAQLSKIKHNQFGKQKMIIGSTQAHASINTDGICPSLTSAMGTGGGQIPMHNYNTLCARDWKDPKCVQIGTLDIKGHDSVKRVYSKEGLSPTLTDMQGGNRQPKIIEDFYKNRPIREYKDVSPTLRSERIGLKVEEPFIVASRGRNPQNPSSRIVGQHTEQRLEPNTKGTSNCISTVQKDNYVVEPKIITYNVPQTVKVRKYDVDTDKLKQVLKEHKKYSNKEIALILDLPITTVEHWFRSDSCFSIPDPQIWLRLKCLLNIETDEFDESIMTFEEKDGVYDKANRIYDEKGLAPTLTQQEEKVMTNRIRKLTPKECWRLMGFSDEDFEKAANIPTSNTQLYKQARK